MRGDLHHVELWVADLERSTRTLGWLLERLGWTQERRWARGASWRLGQVYVVLDSGVDVVGSQHDRRRPGLNHLAFHVGPPADVEELVAEAERHGWRLMFADAHPFAGGAEHYAAYLEDEDGFEVELVASSRA